MTSRSVVTSLVVVAIVIGGFLFLRPHSSSAEPTSAAMSTHDDRLPDAAPPRIAPPPPQMAQRIAAPPDDNDTAAPKTPPPLHPLVIDGTVVVTDARGVEHREEDGLLTPWARTTDSNYDDLRRLIMDATRRPRRLDAVAVKAGRFHVELPSRDELFSLNLQATLGGRPVAIDQAEDEACLSDQAKGGTLALHGHWIEGLRVHVIDKTTHVDLDDVTIVRRKDGDENVAALPRTSHPGAAVALATVVAHGTSPLVVLPRFLEGELEDGDEWFVRAPGHAWSDVSVNFLEAKDATVELGPAATLVVEVSGELPKRAASWFGALVGPELRVRPRVESGDDDENSWQTLVADEPAVLGETRLESLEPGAIEVSVELGDPGDDALVAGRIDAKLVAGATTRVALTLTSVAMAAPVPLAGTLFVPDGWGLPAHRLSIRPVDLRGRSRADERDFSPFQLEPLADRPGWFAWNAGSVVPAKYEFSVADAGFARVIAIAPPGDEHVELVVAEPAQLVVRLVDAATGRPVAVDALAWSPAHDVTTRSNGASINLECDAETSTHSGTVPVGDGEIEWQDETEWTLDEASAKATIHPGDQELTVRLHRTVGVVVELVCNGAKVAWSDDFDIDCKVEEVSGDGESSWSSNDDGALRLAVTHAGRYRVTLPELPGFAAVAPFEVEVPANRFVTKHVELKKKK